MSIGNGCHRVELTDEEQHDVQRSAVGQLFRKRGPFRAYWMRWPRKRWVLKFERVADVIPLRGER